MLEISLTTSILLEIDKIQDELSGNWENTGTQLEKLHRFSKYANDKIRESIWDMLEYISSITRSDMPRDVAFTMLSICISFYPSYEDNETQSKSASETIKIAFNMVYDCFIYLKNYWAAICGLLILKFVYREAKRSGFQEIRDNVMSHYKKLFESINRPERSDLKMAFKMLEYFKDDLENGNISIPPLPDELVSILD